MWLPRRPRITKADRVTPAYTLITANRNYSSWSLRPWLLMKALGIGFADRVEPFAAAENFDAFRAFSPTGQVPVLLHHQRKVWDSLGIVLYLAEHHGGIWPEHAAAHAFAMCGVAEMHAGFSALRQQCPMNVGVRVQKGAHDAALARDVARLGELFSEGLAGFGGPWLAGSAFTALDAFFAPVAFRIRTYALDVGEAGQAWVEHILAHPAMQQWEAEALAESWREKGHEDELLAAGVLTADYRTG
jgi:glutathione S-transferase